MSLRQNVLFGMLLACPWAKGWSPGVSTPVPATHFSVDASQRNDVLSFYQNIYLASENYATAINWTGSVGSCSEGTLSAEFTTLMRRRVNYFRAMAGVSSNISMNDASTVVTSGDLYAAPVSTTKAQAAQKAALLLSRNNTLTHQPSSGLTCFSSAGGNGCYFGNVANGIYGPPAVDAYMREDANNQEAGHRRWILHDSATNFATGDIPRSESYPATNALYIRQRSEEVASVSPAFIAWPPAGFFPWQHSTEYWSLSYPGGDFTSAAISVTKDGVAQAIDSINRSQGFGNNSIIWRVPNIPTSGPDTSYDVTVSNIGGSGASSHTYRITFFSADHLLTAPTLSGITTVAPGGSRNYTIGPVDIAEEYRLEVGKKSAFPSTTVEGGEDATAAFIIPGPVTGTGYNLRSNTYFRSGVKSLNLAFTQVSQREQWVELDRVFLPRTSPSLSFYRRMSFVNSGTTFVAQYCINNDGQWLDIPGTAKVGTTAMSGSINETESTFTAKLTYDLPLATINLPTKVRFLLRKNSPQGFITTASNPSGAFVDDITLNNVDWLSSRTFTLYPANSNSVTLNAASAGETLASGGQYTLRLQPRVGKVWMTASMLMDVSVSNNIAPTLDPIFGPVNLLEDADTQVIPLTGISAGQDEIQSLTINATSSNTGLIPHPTIVYTSPGNAGTLTYKPALNQSGTATITVTVNDGQTSNSTMVRTFNVTVTAVNDPPTISAISDRTIPEDTNTGSIAFTIGDVETAINSLTVTRASVNTTVIPLANAVLGGSGANRTIIITPVANQFGMGEIQITVSDGSTSTTATFIVTVLSVNDAPTLTAISNPSAISEDAAQQTVNLSGISMGTSNELQTLTITATSSNTAVIPHPSVVYTSPNATGSLRYTPVPNAFGTAVITVIVNDGGDANATISRTFTVTVSSVNDRPTISAIPARIMVQNTASPAIAFTIADVETAAASLTVTRSSSNTTLMPTSGIVLGGSGANRTVTLTPASNRTGSATITVTVSDGNLTASSVFSLTVNSQNTAPTITAIGNPLIDEDQATAAIPFTIGDPENLIAALTLSVSSSNTTLLPLNGIVIAGSGMNRTVTLTPAAHAFGSATISITVNDGQSSNATAVSTFVAQVNAVNDAPTISAIPNQSINRNASTGEISFTVADIESSPDSLVVTATSSNLTLVPLHLISLSGSAGNRKISINPAAQITGESTIALTVSDGSATQQSTFVLTVTPPQVVGFDAWVQETYPQLVGSAFDQDFDKDGIANGIEYAFSLDPTQPSKLGELQMNHNASTMRLVMPLPAVRDNVIYGAEYSDGLGAWSSAGMVISIAGGQITATCPLGVNSRFIRWKITKN